MDASKGHGEKDSHTMGDSTLNERMTLEQLTTSHSDSKLSKLGGDELANSAYYSISSICSLVSHMKKENMNEVINELIS